MPVSAHNSADAALENGTWTDAQGDDYVHGYGSADTAVLQRPVVDDSGERSDSSASAPVASETLAPDLSMSSHDTSSHYARKMREQGVETPSTTSPVSELSLIHI